MSVVKRGNGGVVGVENTPSQSGASGIWGLNEVLEARKNDIWPLMPLVEYLVVAGGGGGGGGRNYTAGGGGGGGGYKTATLASSVSGGSDALTLSPLVLESSIQYTLTVGSGGASQGANRNGYRGGTSVFSTVSCTGGGGGLDGDNAGTDERNGGSGGGVSRTDYNNPGTGISDEGHAGGQGQQYTGDYSSQRAGGGGGGANAVGSNGTGTTGGAAGSGKTSSIYATSVAGGGGGGGATGGNGYDGGSNGSSDNASNAPANRGGGGGGGHQASGTDGRAGGNGGSGIIVLRISDSYSATFSVGVTQTNNTNGGYTTYIITAAGPSDTVTFS